MVRFRFDLLAETAAVTVGQEAVNAANSAKSEIWLPFLNTYRTMCLTPPPEFRRFLEKVSDMKVAA